MAINYDQLLSNMNQGFSNQNFPAYAANQGLAVNYNPELNRLTINNVPVDLGKSGLKLQDGQLIGTEQNYQRLMQPFVEQTQGLLDLKPYTTPDYLKQFINDMVAQQLAPYQYNIAEDPAAIAAKAQLEKSMAEMAGKRGFLYGSQQQDIVAQQFEKVAPAFEEQAYQQHQDFLNRQLQLANVVMQWDQLQANNAKNERELFKMKSEFILALDARELDMFKVMLDQRRFNMEIALDEQRLEMQKKEQEMEIAWRKVNELGYADNETAIILGIDPGTEAGWVKQMIAQHQYQMSIMAQKHEYDLEMLQVNKQIEMELIKEREKVQLQSQLQLMETEYGLNMAKTKQAAQRRAEIKAIEDAKRKEAQRQAELEAQEKARQAAQEEIKKTNLDTEYAWAHSQLKYRYVQDGIIPEQMLVPASNYLYELYSSGQISNPTYNRLMALYRIPAYFSSLSSQDAYELKKYIESQGGYMSDVEAESLSTLGRISKVNLANRGFSL
jgi:hypothetical protein